MKDIAPWNVLESSTTYEDPWLRIRTDKCQTPRGYVVDAYHVLECSTWVNVLALTQTREVVLVREYRHGVGQVLVGLPGGAVERQDADPCEAVQRELLEETGYGGGQFFELGRSYANPAKQNNLVWSFLALDVTLSHEQRLDEAEHIEIIHQDFASFSRQVWAGELPFQAMHLATLGFATQFILQSNLPQLSALRAMLRYAC
jgi:8-oxo-dGTP pyrophosphatase MutT (NUDIX family)